MQDPISKITNAKRTGGMAQAAQNMPGNKHKTLSSNPSSSKKRKEEERGGTCKSKKDSGDSLGSCA
jgi:hypothetical protein